MVLKFRLKNVFSFRDEITLDLQAAKIQTEKGKALSGNLFTINGEQILKSHDTNVTVSSQPKRK